MFVERLISGIILVALAILSITWGGNTFFGMKGLFLLVVVGALALRGLYELYRVLKLEKTPLACIVYLATIIYEFMLLCKKENYIEVYILSILLVLCITYVVVYPKYIFAHIAMVFMGFVYVTMTISCLYQVRVMNGGIYLVWIIFIAAWGSDTCAYCVGKLIGKHKLPSPLSPKKTIEGCSGGIIGAALLAFLYAWIFREELLALGYLPWHFLVMGGIGGLLSQIGDLTASAIKRNYDIKDYGKLIPGHGGIMDRFDSILFTAPLTYILLSLL